MNFISRDCNFTDMIIIDCTATLTRIMKDDDKNNNKSDDDDKTDDGPSHPRMRQGRERERERERGCCNLPSSKLRPLYCATPGWQRARRTGLWHAAPRNLYTTNRYCEVLTASLAPWPGWPPGYGATELLASAIFVNTEPGRKSK